MLRSGIAQGYPLSLLLPNLVLEILARVIQQEKGIKIIPTEKEEVRLSLLKDDMIQYLWKPKISTGEYWISLQYSKVPGYKNIPKSRALCHRLLATISTGGFMGVWGCGLSGSLKDANMGTCTK